MQRQNHIDNLLEHYEASQYRGTLAEADVVIQGDNPGCGDIITLYLKVDENNIATDIRFEGEGCTISQGAVSILIEMVQKKSLAEIKALDYNDLIDVLGRDVVLSRVRCATLGLKILKDAVAQYQQQHQPS